jgi:hypothetical protein
VYQPPYIHDFAEEQENDIQKQTAITRDAIISANRQADAAEKANSQFKESMRRQLRAEITFLSIERPNQPNETMSLSVHFKNVGLTTAYAVSSYLDERTVKLDDSGGPPYAFDPGPDQDKDAKRRTMGAGIELGNVFDKGIKKLFSASLDFYGTELA